MSEYEEARNKTAADSGRAAIVKEALEADWFLGMTRRIFEVVE